MSISINPKKILYSFLVIISFLLIGHIIGIITLYKTGGEFENIFIRYFHLDLERNLPSFYSSITLLLSSILLYFIYKWHKETKTGYHLYWFFLSLLFLFLALDESISIHEDIITATRRSLRSTGVWSLPLLSPITSNSYYLNAILLVAWVIPYTVCGILLGVLYINFFKTLPRKTLLLFILAGMIFVTGAIGFELLGGFDRSVHGEKTIYYTIFTIIEEMLEMLGVALFIYALLDYLLKQAKNINLHINK